MPENNEQSEINEGLSNTNLVFRFEAHFLRPSEYNLSVKEKAEEMRNTFKKGERNILFREFVGVEEHTKFFEQGLSRFSEDRFLRSYAYSIYRDMGGFNDEDITEELMDEALIKFKGLYSGKINAHLTRDEFEITCQAGYDFSILAAADMIEKEGYKIDFDREVHQDYDEEKLVKLLVDNNGEKEEIEDFASHIHERDNLIIQQLEEICEENSETKTNILVYIGTFHSELLTRLPAGLKAKVEASSETGYWASQNYNRGFYNVLAKLLYKDTVSDKDWEDYNKSRS